MDFKSTPFDQAVAELSVKENQDPYLVFFYLRTLMEALFLRFNSNPEHVAVLDATPMDYSYGFSLVWEGDPPKVVPITVEEVVSKFHSKELFLEFAEQFKDGSSLKTVCRSTAWWTSWRTDCNAIQHSQSCPSWLFKLTQSYKGGMKCS